MQLHIVNPFANAHGGSELGAIEILRGVAGRCEATLWSESAPDSRLGVPVRRIDAARGEHPRGGTLLLHGNFFPPGSWLEESRPDRLILGYNTTVRPDLKYAVIERLRRMGPFEIVYASRLVRDWVDVPGEVLPSRIDLQRFSPAASRSEGPFVVGRMSRDEPDKHHHDDPGVYRRLADAGVRVRLMGATCLGSLPGVEILPTAAEPAEQFLHTLDCLFYRTSTRWTEAGGRVVAEAMACGLPVVCHQLGGYAEWIEHGRSGFLFDTDAEALRILDALRAEPERRRAVGAAARAAMERMHSGAAAQAYFDFFLR